MRGSLGGKVFVSILAVALGSVVAAGVVVRWAFAAAFAEYLGMPHVPVGMPMGPGQGRGIVIGATERAFQVAVDRGILLAALLAVVFAAVAAILLARGLAGPLARLTSGARALAAGDLEHRVVVDGPDEVEELGEAFNEMADSLERAEDLRRRLVADVAHELRNPVAALRAQVEGMAEGVLEPDAARLRSITEDLGELSRLVDDLQELSVAEAGRLAYDMAPIDIGELAAREAERARALARPSVEVVAECAGALPEVSADERRIAQVLRNLLANATRHTASGEIRVRCAAEGREVRVEVADTGEGIPADALPFVFERFYRADAARARGTGGVGIGLAISRRIVEDHGGRVFIASEPGRGTTVGFTLPAAPSA